MKQVLREDIQLGGGDFRRILDGIPHIRMTWKIRQPDIILPNESILLILQDD